MQELLQDLRYAVRMLFKNPGLAVVVVLSLAVGIGANSAIFSVVDALLLRPVHYPQSDRLVNIWLHSPGIGIFRDWPSPGQYVDLQNQNHSFEEMSISKLRTMTLTGLDQPQRIYGMQTSSTLFHMLGAKATLGRLLLAEEDKPGKPAVAILSYPMWQRTFNSDRQIVGKSITLNGVSYVIAGVLTPSFSVDAETMPAEGDMGKIDVFLPLPLGADAEQRRGDENYNLMARLKPGISVAKAQADVDIIADGIRIKDKRDRTFGMSVVSLQEQVVGDVRRALLVLFGSVALVLMIACANVANLLLTRAVRREKEVAVRVALGAGWQRLVRQLLTESILLSFIGGAAGLLVAQSVLHLVRTINPGNIPRLEEIGISGTVLAFTFGVALFTGILFGLAPVWRVLAPDLVASLKAGGQKGSSPGSLRLSKNRLRGLLVVSQLALSLILLAGAGLLIRSFVRLQNVPPGFNPDHVLTMQVVVTGPNYRDDKPVVQFYQQLEDRVSHLPGAKSTGLVSPLPLSSQTEWGWINVEGYVPPPGQELQVDGREVSTEYFGAMGIPLLNGRFFSESDRADSTPVAIVEDRFAYRFWPGGNPIGKHIWFNPKHQINIVGVVSTVKQYSLDSKGKIAVYFPYAQRPDNNMFLVARTASLPASLADAITHEVHSLDANALVYDVQTMQQRVYDSLARQRFATTMLGAFAAFALLLAAVGVYAVMSYLVSQSTHDIGIRIALGAQRSNVVALIAGQAMKLAVIGILAGLIGALALTRVMASLLFGVTPTDALTFTAVTLILAIAASAATLIPVSRAVGVDPIIALREE